MSRLDEYFAKANRGSQTTSSVSASGDKPASNMDAYFAKAGKPVRTNPLNLYTEALKASQGQSTMQTPYADAAAQAKQSGTQNLYAQAAENAKKSRNAAKGTSVVFNSVYGKADDRASSAGSGKYAGILKASDYTELSKSGESKRKLFGDARYDYINNIGNFRAQSDVQQAQGRGQDYGKYAFMTDDEIGVYNYLYATQGKKAANAYLSDLEPELDKQWYTGTNRATTEALGKNAATRTLASAMTVAAQPTRTITSMIAMADDAVRTAKGQEINPYSKWRQASNITQELRADTSQHIEEKNPGMGGKVGSFVYNTAMSAADSAMNALVAKGIGEAVGLTGDTLMKATNILGSALMSSEAASMSIAESKEKGYSNAGALALGLTRGAIEYASEAVGGEWVIRKIKANPLSFVKSMALTMIPEGMEEVMSDAANGVVNLAIDAAFGTEESGIPKMLEYYRTSGTDWQKKHAELATVLAVLGQEGLSFLGGALATLGSSSVQYGTNRANINQTAERLDTTPKNVVQMMQDAQTENPGVIYALAELTDAENAADLRQKIGTKEDMKRAAEYLTKQMEAGGRSGAQEGTYTAGAQNAPEGAQRAQNEGISTTPAAAINIQEEMNNEQSAYQGRENGSYDLRTGGQAAAEGGAQALAGGRAEIPGGVGADAQADLRQVTPAQLGIRNGGTEAVTVVDARKLGGDAARAYNLLAANNIEPVAVRGAIQVNNGYANAYTESGKVFFRVDAVDSRGNTISPEALVRHELFHNYISEEVLQASDEVIRESMTAEEYDAMYESYRDAYASIYDFENMSEDEIERLLTEEIAADAYAGLNWFSGDAPVQEAVRAETERNAPAQRAEAQQETTGPPEGRTAIEVARSNGDIQRNVLDYADKSARNAAQRTLHDRMVSEGKTLDLTENREFASQYFPDLRSMPKAERTSILREKIRTLKNDLRTYLNQLKGVNFEFEINGNTIEATIYNAGIKEVLQNLTQDKAGMLTASEEIFRNAEYLYSTQDKTGSSTITGWDYFYVPVKMGGDTVGVRIAVRNTVKPREAQIYNWGIKKGDTSLDGVGHLPKGSNSADVSSDASHNSTIRSSTANSQEKSSGRASIVVLPDGKKYVQADRQVIFGDDPDGWADQIEGYINRKIRNGEDVILTTDSGDVLKITEDTAGKASFRNYVRDANGRLRPLTDAEYETKLNAEAHIDELVKISEKTSDKAKPDEIGRTGTPIHGDFAKNGWYYRRAWFCDFDGTYYQVTISTPDGINGVVVYNVGQIERRSPPSFNGSSNSVDETGARRGKSSSTVTIRQTEGNSQEKSSGKASVEVENRDSDNKKQGRKKLSEAEKYQNTTPKMAETRAVRNVAEYEKQISRMEKRLETGGQATLNEGGGNFYRVNIREENGEYYAYISDGKNVVAKHKSKAKMEAIRWAGDRMRAEIASRILYNPDTKLRGSYQSDLKRAENREYPVFKTESGTEVQTVPFWTWVQDKSGHYGLVVGKDINGTVRAWFPFGGDGTGTVVTAANTTLYAVEGDYESRAWNNEIVAEALDDAEESAAARNARKDKMRESQEIDRQEPERLRARENLGAGQRFVPNKSSGEVYRDLMGKGKSEVKVQMTGFLKGTPKESTFKVEVKPTPIGGYYEATVFHDGHKADTLVRALKETAARDAAEEVITMANKNFSEENYQRAKKFEAEKTADEDARIAELFGDPEQLDSTEPSPKGSDAAETENTAAGTTINATTEKVTSEVIKAERNFREDFEKITSGAMRMFVNAGETVRRISKQTKNKSLEGYYFNAGAYSQRAGNWIAKGGARTDISGHKTGESLMDILGDIMKTPEKYKDFQLMLLHRNNVDRMRYDSTEEVQNLTKCVTTIEDLYPKLRGLDNDYLYQTAVPGDKRDMLSREWKETVLDELLNGEMPEIADISEAAQMLIFTRQKISEAKKNGLKPVFGYEVTAYDSQLEAERLLKANPEFDALAKRVYAYFDDLLQYRIDAGLDTQKHVDAMKKRYPNYVPTMRVEGTEGKTARRARRNGGIVVSNAIGRAVGGDAVIMPLHTAMSRKTVAVMKNAGLNQFGEQLVQSWNQDKSIPGVNKVDLVDYSSTDQYVDSEELYVPVTNNVFSVLRGNDRYNITMDEGLAQALNAFQPDKYANSDIAKLLKKGNDLFKALCTGYNPIFMVRNLVRDAQDAAFYSTDSATWAKMFPSAWKQIVTNGEIWQQYKALGGSYASMLDYTTGMVKEPKSAAGKIAAKYESLGQAIEAAPRLAEFMTILANKGGSKTVDGVKTGKFTQSDLMEAMLGAADITTNFARGGSVTKALNRYLVPFLNPSIQGFDKFIRNATETRSVKAAASLILKAALINLPPLLLNGLMHGDDDDWDDIPASTKANYYLINAGKLFGNGYWIKIPKGRAIAVLSTAAVYTQEKQKGEDVKFSDVFEVIKSNIAPTDIFNQNIATAWTQAKLTNPDNPGTTWYGGNIESDRLQNYRPEDRYDEKTDELSKAIGKLFKVSPKKVNYLLDQYSGVIGDILLPLITPATKSSHWLLAAPQAAFTIDTTSTNKTTGEYYDLLDDLKYDANDGDIGAGITRKYVSHAGDEVNDYYQQIRAIQNDKSLSDGEKNRIVRALKAQLIERQKEIIAQAEPYREAVNDYLKAHPELSTDNDAAIAEYAERYEITEDQAESRMDAIVYREANREVFGAEYALRTYNADVYDKARAAYAKGVSYDTYYDYYFATKEMHADKDENGKSISGSKKAKVVEFINSLDIPPEQKDALYVAAGYTAKSARNQKWNGGSGGSGGRRGRGKRTALKAPTPKAPEIIIPRSGTASSAKAGGTSKTPKVSGNVIADFTKTASGTDIQKAVTQAKRKALKAGNRTVYVEEGSPIDYFLKYGKLPSLK